MVVIHEPGHCVKNEFLRYEECISSKVQGFGFKVNVFWICMKTLKYRTYICVRS